MDSLYDNVIESTPNGYLTRVWRRLLIDSGQIQYITRLRNEYINSVIISSELSNTKVAVNLTNITNKIMTSNMTWKNLIFLMRHVMRLRNITLELTIDIGDKSHTVSAVGLTDDLLSVLWKEVTDELDYDMEKLEELLSEYIKTKKDKIKNKTNLRKKLIDKCMTWKNLIFLLSNVLGVKKISTVLTITYSNKTYTKHKLSKEL